MTGDATDSTPIPDATVSGDIFYRDIETEIIQLVSVDTSGTAAVVSSD